MDYYAAQNEELETLLYRWELQLLNLSNDIITLRRNSQNRSIKQILGHMIDSATNNTLRIINLQNLPSPLQFPNYASNGNNDRWIAIQNYQEESWNDLVLLWKYANLHIIHVIKNVDNTMLENVWIAGENEKVSLNEMIVGYLGHFKLHLSEIQELIEQ